MVERSNVKELEYLFWGHIIDGEYDAKCLHDGIVEPNITIVKIEHIDRVVEDFRLFYSILLNKYPNIQELEFSQHWRISIDDDFLFFIKELKLKKLTFYCHGMFYHDWSSLLPYMPENSEYKFVTPDFLGTGEHAMIYVEHTGMYCQKDNLEMYEQYHNINDLDLITEWYNETTWEDKPCNKRIYTAFEIDLNDED